MILLRSDHRRNADGRFRWSLNVTRWFYLSNGTYVGEHRWYMRIGQWPRGGRSFGPIRRDVGVGRS